MNAGAKKRCVAIPFPSSSGAGGKEKKEERRGTLKEVGYVDEYENG